MGKCYAWRELHAVLFALNSFQHFLKGNNLYWYSDNKSIISIVQKGSMKNDLHEIAVEKTTKKQIQ